MYRTTHSNPKITKFLPQSDSYEKSGLESNPMTYPEYLYLSGSAFLVKLTAPSKQFAKAISVFKSRDHVSNS